MCAQAHHKNSKIMMQQANFIWCGISSLQEAQKTLNDVYIHQDFKDLPLHARTFTRRFVAFVKRAPASLMHHNESSLFTIKESNPMTLIGFFVHNAKTKEMHLTISYEDIK